LTRFLYITTLIFLVVGIPVSTIYWWPQFWGPQFSHPGYWDQWVHWLKIASAVLAALWILDLIIWIKKKREESKFYRDRARAMNISPPENASPRGPDWIAPEQGPAYRPEDKAQSEPIGFVDSVDASELINSQSSFEHGADFLTNQRINRLLEEGEITIKEAEATRRQTKNMDFLERERFLSAIEHRPTK
jgi:hypothetical protein